MVNMAGDRLPGSRPRGFVILQAEHLEFRPVPAEAADADSEAIA
jgi:hypothetical protein